MIISTLVSLYLVVYSYRVKGTPGVTTFLILNAAITILSVGKLGEILSQDLASKALSVKFLMIGINLSSLSWLMLGLQQAYRFRKNLNRVLVVCASFALVDLLVIWTNDLHQVFWEKTFIRSAGDFQTLGTERGPWFILHTLMNYVMAIGGSIAMLLKSYASATLHSRQRLALLIAVLVPLVPNIIFIFQLVEHPLDYTPLGYALSCLLLAYGYLRLHLVDAIPLAMDSIIETLPDPVIILDNSNRIRLLNRAARELLEDERSHLTGEVLTSILASDSPWQSLVETKSNATITIQDKNQTFETRPTPVTDRDGQVTSRLFMLQNVTQRLHAEEAHQENLKFFRQFAEALPIPFYELDNQQVIIYANKEMLGLLGYEQQELFGKGIESLFLPLATQEQEQPLNSNPDISVREEIALSKNGIEIPVINLVANLVDESFSTARRGVLIDITHRKRLEDAISQSLVAAEQANEVKSQFLANMSHEIRTPMNGVIGFAQLLAGTDLNENQQRYVELILKSGRGLLQLINDILDLSRIEAGKMQLEYQAFSPEECISDVASIFSQTAETQGVDFVLDIQDSLPDHLMGDVNRIAQILNNVIGNAIKFTEAGCVTIKVNCRHQAPAKALLLIAVQDTGIGIEKDAIERLFNPFAQLDGSITRKFGGTGLGLAITADLLRLMNGTISVSSTPGEGSTFYIELLLDLAVATGPDSSNQYAATSATPDDSTASHYRILLVEDNPVNREVAMGFLEKMGLSVEVAENGREALNMTEHCRYDLILMDIHMPQMDGLEATRRIRQQGASSTSPIIGVTADVMAGQKERCLAAGMTDHLAKPIVFQALKDVVNKHLQSTP